MKEVVLRLSRWWGLGLIVSLIGAFVLPNMMGNIVDLQINKVFADLQSIQAALKLYKEKFGDYPAVETGLAAMTGVTIKRISKDPWGNAYAYRRPLPAMLPMVYSIGVDGVDSGGAGDDITSKDKQYQCADYAVNCGFSRDDLPVLMVGFLGLASLMTGIARGMVAMVRWAGKRRDAG